MVKVLFIGLIPYLYSKKPGLVPAESTGFVIPFYFPASNRFRPTKITLR